MYCTSNPYHAYLMDGKQLGQVDQEKDLGVLIDRQLKFHAHTAAACNKANQILAVVRKSFANLNEYVVPLLYKSLVRPHLEYGNSIWGPHYKLDQYAVERVQRTATRLGVKELPYINRLRRLNLPSLVYRRRRGDMIQVYKLKSGMERIEPALFFQDPPSNRTRGHKWKLYKTHAQKDIRRHCFSCRVVDDWNALPEFVINAKTLNEFKTAIDRHWTSERFILP